MHSGQSLEYLIYSYNKFEEKMVRVYARDLVCAVNSIHQAKLVHGNLKASNILVSSQTKRLVLVDFNLFTATGKANPLAKSIASAPEILLDQ